MKMNWKLTVVLLTLSIHVCFSQRKSTLSPTQHNPCVGQKTCGTCIAAGKDCAWCKAPGFDTDNKERCNLISELSHCPDEHLTSPKSIINKTQDLPPQDGTSSQNPVQVQPQIIDLKIRPNDPQKITLTFKLARNYPLDLYYLMDLSESMKNHKDRLATQGDLLDQTLSSLTNNYRLGFGSFVDKTTMPYVDPTTNKTSQLCSGCEPAYGFKNRLAMTTDHQQFKSTVNNTKVSINLESPKGGLDAVMQAVACETEIGWRQQSRKMLLYSSDGGYHFAGDALMGGIKTPNDGQCHLDSSGNYTESTTQDYPSVSQIAKKLVENNVHMLFAITADQGQTYSTLKKFLPGSETGVLAVDSSNVINLIKENYEKILSKVEMMSSNGAEDVIVKYFSKCKGDTIKETNICEGLKIGESVSFEVQVEVKECPVNTTASSRSFYIKPFGLSDKLEIRMELICQCPCETNEVLQSPNCNNHGTDKCGICTCDENYFGRTCDCHTNNGTQSQREEECKKPGESRLCSGRGECVCGTCECKSRGSSSEERYSGRWCECDDYSCPFYKGYLCGGPGHGMCGCGSCNCSSSFSGEDCSCSTKTDSCIASDGSICGGPEIGRCVCNRCVCTGNKYQGPTCEDCKDCQLVCNQHKECVQCVAYGSGPKKDSCGECKTGYITTQGTLPDGYNSCQFKDEDDCIFYFTYNYDDRNKLVIVAQTTKECPTKVNVLAIVLGVIFGIVCVGVAALVIWKIVTTIKDRREFAAFEKEYANAKLEVNQNPYFKPATTHHRNPIYNPSKK